MIAATTIQLAAALLAPLILAAVPQREAPSAPVSAYAPDDPPPDEIPIDVDLLELTDIEYRPGDPLPAWIQELDGRRVRIAGYMHASTGQGADEFMLVTDSCVCGGQPQPHHFVDVSLDDEEVDYRPGMVEATGTFSAGEVVEDGYVVSLFRLQADLFE